MPGLQSTTRSAHLQGDAPLYRDLLDQLGCGVAVYRAVDGGDDFAFVDFNSAAERIDEISCSDVVGRRVTDIFPGVREFGLLGVMRRVWRTGEAERHPISQYRDGRISGWRDNRVFRLPGGEVVAVYEDRTSQKDAEDRVRQLDLALTDSEHRFRSTFEQAAVGMAHIGLDGRFLRLNDKLCEITGYSRDELTLRTFQDITHPDDIDADLALAADLWAGRLPHYRIAKRYLRRDGSIVWVNLTASTVRDGSGRPEYGIAVVEDISAQKEAERLRANEELQRMALSAGKAGAWEYEASTGEQVWSQETYEMFGLEPTSGPPSLSEWLGRFVHPDDRVRITSLSNQPKAPGDQFDIEFRASHPQTGQRWLEARGRLIREPDGRLVRSFGLILDVTDQRRLQDALRASETRLRMAMAAGEIGMWEWEIGSGKVSWSEDLMDRTHSQSRPFGGTYEAFRAAVHPDDLPRVEAALEQAVKGEREYRIEFRMLAPDGSVRWSETRGAVICNPEGRPERMIGIDMDITARKAAEALQSLLASELNHRVKNLLSTVDAIMRSTLRAAPSLRDFGETFSSRLRALARGNDLLVRSNWRPVEMSAVLEGALGSFGGAVQISAPPGNVQLPAKAALGLNLILHELATNAAKYGALSTPNGKVSVLCERSASAPAEIVCRWREQGGPVVQPPEKKGFGSTLIGLSARHDLRGDATIAYHPAGLECVLRFPVEARSAGDSGEAGAAWRA
ncbi:MAG TPA: PAS domain-containing protein [Phenylobacterium sp.]